MGQESCDLALLSLEMSDLFFTVYQPFVSYLKVKLVSDCTAASYVDLI